MRGSDGYASTSSPTLVPGRSVPSRIRNLRDTREPLTFRGPNSCPYPPGHATPQICLVRVFAVDGSVIRPSASAYARRFSTIRGWIGSRSLSEKYQPTQARLRPQSAEAPPRASKVCEAASTSGGGRWGSSRAVFRVERPSSVAKCCSQTRRLSLSVGVISNSSAQKSRGNTAKRLICSGRASSRVSLVDDALHAFPNLRALRQRAGASAQDGRRSPTMSACESSASRCSSRSMFCGAVFLAPAVAIKSFFRSVMRKKPPGFVKLMMLGSATARR